MAPTVFLLNKQLKMEIETSEKNYIIRTKIIENKEGRKSVKRRPRKKESTLDRILEVPKEIATNEPKLTIAGFKQMLIENYKAILEYQDIYIRIKTYTGIININGFNLKLGEMTSDDIMVTGNIETIDFEKIED